MKTESNVFQFSDYRAFLKDRYRQLKDTDPAFSFRTFSKEAGFGSPNYLKLVMDGKRNLSDDAIPKFSKGLRLDRHEAEYFRYLVSHNQCSDIRKKAVYEAKLEYLNELFRVKDLIPELYDYYHDWYHSAIREMVKKGETPNSPDRIARRLVPSIKEEEARTSIDLLKKLNFIQEEDGMLKATERTEAIEPSVGQKIHHEQMAALGAQSIYTQDAETQGFESVTVSVPEDKIDELKVRIRNLMLELAEAGSGNSADAVFQLNVQLFALTKSIQEAEARATEVPTLG